MSDRFEISNRVFVMLIILVSGIMVFWGFRIYEIWQTSEGNYPREITVDGKATAQVTPDVAKVVLGIRTEEKTSEEAVTVTTGKMKSVMEELEKMGIPKEDIRTTNYYLGPNYQWSETEGNYQDGYVLTQDIEVKTKKLDSVGDIIKNASDAGINTVGGISFEIEDLEKAKDEAREEALEVAKEKAEKIKEVAGIKLGRVVNYYEYVEDPYYYGKGGYSYYAEDAAVEVPAIEPGQQDVTITVNLTYAIR